MAFGQHANGGKFVFVNQIGQAPESPAQDGYVGGGEGHCESFWRRGLVPRFIITFGIRVGFQGEFDQVAAVKTTTLLADVEFDAEAMSVDTLETIVFKVGHGGCGVVG